MTGEILVLTREALTHGAAERQLDGRRGANRGRSRQCQLGEDVDNDVAAVFTWLRHRARTEKTRRVFLSEVRRLYYWLFFKARKPLSSLTLKDLEDYREFLRDPRPRNSWVGPKVPYLSPDGGLNKDWRPFEKPMTEAHVTHVFAVLKSLFRYLTEAGYLDGNPLFSMAPAERKEIGDDSAREHRVTERALDEEQWAAALEAVETMPRTTAREAAEYERARYILKLFYHLGARITEIIRHRMEHFIRVNGCWKWSVVGKGGKHREIGVNSELLEAIERYRRHLNEVNPALQLAPLPVAGEPHPILFNVHGKKPLSTRQLFRIIKEIFTRAYQRYKEVNPQKAAALKHASPHWIRHATASHLAKNAKTIEEVRAVQQHMRHSDMKTTLAYTHVEDETAAAVAERLTKKRPGHRA